MQARGFETSQSKAAGISREWCAFQKRITGCRSSVLWLGAAAMSKALAQRPSAIFLLIDGFELPATKRFLPLGSLFNYRRN